MTAQLLYSLGSPLTWIMLGSFILLFKLSPTMQSFKQAGTKEAAAQIWRQWGASGQAVARRNLTYDWFFILVYSTTWIAGTIHLTKRFDSWWGVLAWIVGAIGLIGAVSDIIENRCLLQMMRDDPSESAARLCKRIMRVNMTCWLVAAIYFFVALLR